MFNNEDENENIEENTEIEIVFGDDSELEISDVQGVDLELKPIIKEKKKNIVIPVAKSAQKKDFSEDDDKKD